MGTPKNREIEIGALDTETGGLNPQKNGLISIAVVPPKHLKELQPISVLIEYNDALVYETKALEVNGFYPIKDRETNEFFWWQTVNGKRQCTKGLPEKEAINIVLTYLEVYLKDSFIAGCNIGFDKSFLLEACKRIDASEPSPSTPVKTSKSTKPSKSFQHRLDKCLLRKTLELQTLAICAHVQNQITLPYTSKPATSKAPDQRVPNDKDPRSNGVTEQTKRRPSVSLDSIAKAVSEADFQSGNSNAKEIKRDSDQHNALEDAILTLKLTEELTRPWEMKKDIAKTDLITPKPTKSKRVAEPMSPDHNL